MENIRSERTGVKHIETIKVKFSAKFKNREQAKRWRDFHQNVAQLEVLCKWCHEEETHG